jgi:hypothetical protein
MRCHDGINWARQPLWSRSCLEEYREWDAAHLQSSAGAEGDTAHMWYNESTQDVIAIGYATAPLPFPEAWLFADDLESGDTSTWTVTVPVSSAFPLRYRLYSVDPVSPGRPRLKSTPVMSARAMPSTARVYCSVRLTGS